MNIMLMKKLLKPLLFAFAVQGKVAQENQAATQKSVERWLEGLGMEK